MVMVMVMVMFMVMVTVMVRVRVRVRVIGRVRDRDWDVGVGSGLGACRVRVRVRVSVKCSNHSSRIHRPMQRRPLTLLRREGCPRFRGLHFGAFLGSDCLRDFRDSGYPGPGPMPQV